MKLMLLAKTGHDLTRCKLNKVVSYSKKRMIQHTLFTIRYTMNQQNNKLEALEKFCSKLSRLLTLEGADIILVVLKFDLKEASWFLWLGRLVLPCL